MADINGVALGPNQEDWVKGQELLRKLYPWLGEIGEVPDEQLLEKLAQCPVSEYNTSCFESGRCLNPKHKRCVQGKEQSSQ